MRIPKMWNKVLLRMPKHVAHAHSHPSLVLCILRSRCLPILRLDLLLHGRLELFGVTSANSRSGRQTLEPLRLALAIEARRVQACSALGCGAHACAHTGPNTHPSATSTFSNKHAHATKQARHAGSNGQGAWALARPRIVVQADGSAAATTLSRHLPQVFGAVGEPELLLLPDARLRAINGVHLRTHRMMLDADSACIQLGMRKTSWVCAKAWYHSCVQCQSGIMAWACARITRFIWVCAKKIHLDEHLVRSILRESSSIGYCQG